MSRKIVMFAAGSRGDIQPCIALGRGLADRGDTVRIIASSRYKHLVAAAGLEHAPLSADPTEIVNSEEGQAWLAGGRNPVKFVRGLKRIVAPRAKVLLAEVATACADADVVLYPTMGFVGYHMAQQLGIPGALIHFQPSQPTRSFPHPLVPAAGRLGPLANKASYSLVDQGAWQLLRPFINRWRSEQLGLPKLPISGPMRRVRRERLPVLCCWSSAVVPRPADWPSYVNVTGYWFVDQPTDWTPPQELMEFLAAGPPPVYVGFGSMVPSDPAETDRVVRAALRRAGVRGVLLGDPETTPGDDDIHVVADVPHSWLFPRMAAVVHHGGAGTTGAALRAGVPNLVCPFFGDQPFWGDRVAALGAGPQPIPVTALTVDGLAEAVGRAAKDEAMRAAAVRVSQRIEADNGVEKACDVVAGLLREPALP